MMTFFLHGIRHALQVGTVFPSSPWVARAMAGSVQRTDAPRRVLEVGPGTGAITRQLLPRLDSGDELHLVEINPSFCRHLESRLLEPHRATHPDVHIELHCASVLSADIAGPFDVVICSLPFRAFSPPMVRRIVDRLADLLGEGGRLVYMEYGGTRYLKSPFVGRSRRLELRRIEGILRRLNAAHEHSRELVWLNVLPSFVVHVTR